MRALAFAFASILTACFVAPPPEPPPDEGSPDAAPGGAPDAPGTNSTCTAPATPPGTGNHNAGLQCLSCHTGTAAPRWYAAGTLYVDAAGSAPVAGATLTITDATGKSVQIVSASNGNFWTPEPLTAPLRVKASRCPTSVAMNGTAAGACNSCHAAGGSPGRIVLP